MGLFPMLSPPWMRYRDLSLTQKPKSWPPTVYIIYCNKFFVAIGYLDNNFCCNKVDFELIQTNLFVAIGHRNSNFRCNKLPQQ